MSKTNTKRHSDNMKTIAIHLSTNPTFVTDEVAYIQAVGGEFLFVFSEKRPTNLNPKDAHLDTKVYVDGKLGKLWAWKKYSWKTKLIVST